MNLIFKGFVNVA